VAEIDSERAKALNLKEVHGVEVKSVDHDSPAAKAGLKESDVVLEYNGQRIEGTEQFVRLVRETPVDRQVKLLVWRNGGDPDVDGHHRPPHGTVLVPHRRWRRRRSHRRDSGDAAHAAYAAHA
jgi:predicted metalloprotease with PDZ domain